MYNKLEDSIKYYLDKNKKLSNKLNFQFFIKILGQTTKNSVKNFFFLPNVENLIKTTQN
jgi:hypothetical protein